MSTVDWRTAERGIYSQTKDNATLEKVLETLKRIRPFLGERSQGKKSLVKLGMHLSQNDIALRIMIVVCPDWSHKDGKYTFRSLGGDIPLLYLKHQKLLGKLSAADTDIHVKYFLADTERSDLELLKASGVSVADFDVRIEETMIALERDVASKSFAGAVSKLSDILEPATETSIAKKITSDEKLHSLVVTQSINRSGMYQKIKRNMSPEEMLERTLRTAAQYIAVSRHALENDLVICNHTTTNLPWIDSKGGHLFADKNKANVSNPALIHAPFTVY